MLQISVFHLAGNCKATVEAPESCRSHVENRREFRGAVEGIGESL